MDDELYFSEKFDRLHAWLDLLLLTNYKPNSLRKRGIKVQLEAGELAISIRDLAERWKWSVNTVRKYLDELVLTHKIEIRKSNIINVLRIINWQKYQTYDTQIDTQNDTQNDTQIKKEENFPPNPPYKEERNIKERKEDSLTQTRAYACAREGDNAMIAELQRDEAWQESVCMALHISKPEVRSWLSQFGLENTANGGEHYSRKDLQSHFVSWLKIQIKQKQDGISRNNNRPTKTERDAEFAQFIAAKFAGNS